MKIVLLSGWKRSGKDTAAKYLIEKGYERRAFADSLKDDVAKFLGIRRSDMDDETFKETAILDRPVAAYDAFSKMVAEFLAPEFRTRDKKKASTTGWVDNKLFAIEFKGFVTEGLQLYWTPRAACIFIGSVGRAYNANHWVDRALKDVSKNTVVSDFRYKSEYDRVVQLFGKENICTVRINRFDTVDSKDDSERNLDDFEFDYVIDNKSSIEDYFNNLKRIFG
jgi:hypothetical protein